MPGAPRFDGILSPHALVDEGGAIVLDFRKSRMRGLAWAEAEVVVAQAPRRLSARPIDVMADQKFVVDAQVDGALMRLAVATGAARSLLYVPRGSDLRPEVSRFGRQRVTIRVGDVGRRMEMDLLEPAFERAQLWDGWLGMDVLRGCVIAFDRRRLVGGCDDDPQDAEVAAGRGVDPSAGIALASGLTKRRRAGVEASTGGPRLQPLASGGYRFVGDDVIAEIHRDGTIEVHELSARWMSHAIRHREDERDERRWLLDETLDLRARLAAAWDRDRTELAND